MAEPALSDRSPVGPPDLAVLGRWLHYKGALFVVCCCYLLRTSWRGSVALSCIASMHRRMYVALCNLHTRLVPCWMCGPSMYPQRVWPEHTANVLCSRGVLSCTRVHVERSAGLLEQPQPLKIELSVWQAQPLLFRPDSESHNVNPVLAFLLTCIRCLALFQLLQLSHATTSFSHTNSVSQCIYCVCQCCSKLDMKGVSLLLPFFLC